MHLPQIDGQGRTGGIGSHVAFPAIGFANLYKRRFPIVRSVPRIEERIGPPWLRLDPIAGLLL